MSTQPEPGSRDLLRLSDVTTVIHTPHGLMKPVDGVSLTIDRGESVALVGESGCGKSFTARTIMGLLPPNAQIVSGSVTFAGRELTTLSEREMRGIRGKSMSMVFQDPMTYLDPLMRVGHQIAEAMETHQGDAPRSGVVDALKMVRIPDAESIVEYYPHQLSGGMRQRVLIAMALACRPALLIADEPTTALDVTLQAQIMHLLAQLRAELDIGLLLITHNLGLVAEYCDRVTVMYAGQVVEQSDVFSLFDSPRHPYTEALLKSVSTDVASVEVLEGQPPNLLSPPQGCRFHPRCPYRFARCSDDPDVFWYSDGEARCWLRAPSNGQESLA